MQGDAQQTPFGRVVNGEIEDDLRERAVDDVLDAAGGLFEHQEFVGADERHRRRLLETGDHRAHRQVGIDQTLAAATVPQDRGR